MSVLTTNLKKYIIWYKFASILAWLGGILTSLGIIGLVLFALKIPWLLLLVIPYGLGVCYCLWYASLVSKCAKTLKTIEISNYIVSLETLATEQANLIRAQGIVLVSSFIIGILTLVGIVVSRASFIGGHSNSDSSISSPNKSYSNSNNSTRLNNSTNSSSSGNFHDPLLNNTNNGSNSSASSATSSISASQSSSNSTTSSTNPNSSSTSDNSSSSYTNSSSSTIINFN